MNNDFDDIFSSVNNAEEVEVLDVEEPPKKKFKLNFDLKNDKILFIQLLLILIWLILTIVIYFFGYPLFKNFINV